MANNPKVIYWDSCVFISAIQQTSGRYEILREILAAAQAGEIVILTSTLAIAEVVRIYPKDDATQSDKSSSDLLEDAKKIRSFFNNDYISVYQVDRGIAEKAAEISREYNLTPPDAIHIATAIKRPCLHLQTYDGEQNRRGKLLRFHNKIGYPLLQIIKPQWPLPGMPQSLLLE